MLLNGEIRVSVPVRDVWKVFMDPELLGRAMPSCEWCRRIDATHYEASFAHRVSLITIRSQGMGELLRAQEPHYLEAGIAGETKAMPGTFRGLMSLELIEIPEGTLVRYTFDIGLFGRLGSLGEPLIRSTAQKTAAHFAENIEGLFSDGRVAQG